MENEIANGGIQLQLYTPDSSTPVEDTLGSAADVASGKGYSAGTIDESMLSEEERQAVDKLAGEIDISNIDQVVRYGSSAQDNISDFSVSVLEQVRTMDLGDIGDSLKDLTVALDVTVEPEKRGIAGLIQKAKRSVSSVKANYVKAEENVSKIEDDLRHHQTVLMQDISMYQQMYDLNTQYYKELTMYIIAGKKALDQARRVKLEELRIRADETDKPEDAEQYKDFLDQCNRFEKKLNNLEITRMIAIQAAPQVRLLQNNDWEMLDKIQSSLSNTIPLWRNQLVLSLGIEHSRKAVKAQQFLSDKTNELLVKNAETLKMASIDTAKESERPIVDVDTLRQCNRNLISSINEVVRIHEQGNGKRQRVHDELVRIESELKQALIEVKS